MQWAGLSGLRIEPAGHGKEASAVLEVILEPWIQVRELVRSRGWDGLWITQAVNRKYVTGFSGSAGWVLIPAQGKPVLMTDGRYLEQATQETQGITIVISQQDPRMQWARLLQRKKIVRLGFEDEDLSVGIWRQIQRSYPEIKGLSASGIVDKLRAIKNAQELAYIQKAIAFSEAAFQAICKKIRVGKSERALAFEFDRAMLAAGAEGNAFPTIVASGLHSALPHASPTDRCLQVGDLLVLDFGGFYKNYVADLTRTLAIGKSSKKQQETYKLVKKAQELSQKDIYSGQKVAVCDKKARSVFKAKAVEQYFVHSLGHGIGQEVHEFPRISKLSQDCFQAGMVVTCEPGLYFPGWGGIRIEDDLLVQEQSAEWLSRSPQELQIVGR